MGDTPNAVQTAQPKAVVKKPTQTLEGLLTGDAFAAKLKSLLPTYLPAKTFVQVVCTQLRKTPKLAKCDPTSFFGKLQECAESGLAPNGKHAYLVPFENRKLGIVECQLLIGYKGLAMLAKKYGGVTNIYCELWFDADTLTNDTGDIHHIINYQVVRNPENMLGVVCVVTFKDGSKQGIVVQKHEIDAVRDRAQSYQQAKRYGKDCPWMTDYGEMAKKTAFRRLSKWLDLSPEFDIAVEKDDADYIDVEAETVTDIPKSSKPKQIVSKQKPKELPAPEQPEPEPEKVPVAAGDTDTFEEAEGEGQLFE